MKTFALEITESSSCFVTDHEGVILKGIEIKDIIAGNQAQFAVDVSQKAIIVCVLAHAAAGADRKGSG